MTNRTFCFAWSEEGWETLIDLTAIDQECVMAKIADKPMPQTVNSILHLLKYRAQANEHRRMEVWVMSTDGEFTEDMWNEMIEQDMQMVADLVRANGEQIAGRKPGSRPAVIV